MDRFDPFVKYADVYGDIINWEKDPMNKPQNQNKYFFSDGKTYYEQICKMLRLMSVFKEAFNQIYSNEDEISEAWENFVNNLSASVVEGSEPDVTLTWTDDSVNFEFTMVPGVPGEQGVGITSISFNSDYTMTITLSDGNTYTSMSLKGETGPQGPQGETGSGLQILDVYATLADLQSAHPTGQPGDAYQVGSGGSYTLYIWSSSQSAWIPAGSLGTVSPSLSNPLMDGTASAGSLNQYSRGDHVHPTDTSRASQDELDALIRTSQALIDQSFTYRESPAIQDGLARIDKIKGNTLVWNQLASIVGEQTGTTGLFNTNVYVYNGHKYLMTVEATPSSSDTMYISLYYNDGSNRQYNQVTGTSSGRYVLFINCNYTASGGAANVRGHFWFYAYNATSWKNLMLIDLTRMFGAGNEPTTIEEFTSLFSLPYYDYNAGTLLSFNGTGLKTGGENLIDFSTLQIGKNWMHGSAVDRAIIEFPVEENKEYTISFDYSSNISNTIIVYRTGWNSSQISNIDIDTSKEYTFTPPSTCRVVCIQFNARVNGFVLSMSDFYGFWNCALTDTFSTKALPVSTYFPTGMKSKGSVYDELTPSKAITRIGSRAYQSGDESDTSVITDGVNTYYPLATPTETDIDLDLDFMAYEDGTEQLLPVNGSVPSTSPIIADMTYLSIDDAMEYILGKLANVPQNTQQILESLEDDVADLQTDVGALQPAVSALQTSVGNINTNIGQLSSTVAGHTASISDMQSDITDLNTGLSDLEDTVTDNTSRIGTLETGLATTNGNVQSLSSQVQSIDGRVTNLESDLFKVVVKEFDYDSVASESNFGTTTPITQEEGYRVIGVVGTEAQAGEYTSPASNIAITQCHIYYTSLGALTITIFGRNTGASTRTNVRIYAYLLCIKDIQ